MKRENLIIVYRLQLKYINQQFQNNRILKSCVYCIFRQDKSSAFSVHVDAQIYRYTTRQIW